MRYKSLKSARILCSLMAITLISTNSGGVMNFDKTVYAAGPQAGRSIDIDDVFYKTLKQMSVSNTHALSLDVNGHVYSQGKDSYGQLGVGNTDEAVKSIDLTACLPEISRVWAFDNISFFEAENGNLYACGNNSHCQLGLPSGEHHVPTRVNLFDNATRIKEILHSNNATFFVTTNGKVYACGDNSTGWFGIGPSESVVELQDLNIETTVGTLADFAVGDGFAVAINTAGEIFFAGDNSSGQTAMDDMTEASYVQFTKLSGVPLIAELDTGCYHQTATSISGYKLFAGGNLYSVAMGIEADATLSALYNVPIGAEIYPELLVFGLSEEVSDEYFLGKATNPFQVPISRSGVNCKKITNFSVDTNTYIYNVEDVYHSDNFAGIVGINNKGERMLSVLGDTDGLSWGAFTGVDVIYNFPLWLPQNGMEGLSVEDMHFTEDYFICRAKDEDGIVRYLYGGADVDETPGWILNSGAYLCLSEEDLNADGSFFQKATNPTYKEFLADEMSVDMNDTATVFFETQGNTNFVFKIDQDNVCKISAVSDDKRSVEIKGLNEGSAVLQVIEVAPDGTETIVDTCDIQVKFSVQNINGKFDKTAYELVEGNSIEIAYSSSMPNLEVEFEIEDSSIATLNQFMQLTGVKPGSTKLFAMYNGKRIAVADITVAEYTEDIQMVCHEATVLIGKTVPMSEYVSIIPTSEIANLTYESENTAVCTVDASSGLMTAVAAGTTKIKVTHRSGEVGYINVTVVDNSMSADNIKISVPNTEYALRQGNSIGLDISVTPLSEQKNIQLQSEDESICTVDSSTMKITGVSEGQTFVNITHPKTGTIKVKVTVYESVSIKAPATKEVKVGEKVALGVEVLPVNEKANITYRSENSGICSISKEGVLQGNSVGKTKIFTLYNGVEHSETSVSVVREGGTSGPSSSVKEVSYSISNQLKDNGKLEVYVGSTTSLGIKLNNVSNPDKSEYKPKIKVISGGNRINIEKTKDDFKFDIVGEKEGDVVLEIYNEKSNVPPIQLTVEVSFMEMDTDKVSVSSSAVKDKTVDKDNKVKATKIELKERHVLKVSGTNKVNMDEYFDDYFKVSLTGDSVKYLGDGVISAVKPGASTLTLVDRNTGEKLGKLKYVVPFPEGYFTAYPGGLAIPKDREIEIRFNDNLKASTVTTSTVFVQSTEEGNGENIPVIVSASGNKVSIELRDSKSVSTGRYFIFFTEDICDENGNKIISPISIPINLIEKTK